MDINILKRKLKLLNNKIKNIVFDISSNIKKIDYKGLKLKINKLVSTNRNIVVATTAVSFIIFYMVGAFALAVKSADTQATETFQVGEYTAVKVLLDGSEVCIISKDENIDGIIGEICSDLGKTNGMEARLVNNLETKEIHMETHEDTISKDQIKELISEKGDFKFVGYALMVDNKEIGVLKTKKELVHILGKIKEPYINDKKVKRDISEVTFAEDVQIVEKIILPDEIDNGDKIYKALTKDLTGQEDVIVKEGDTIWDIARKYGTNEETIYKLNPELSEKDYLMIDQKIKVAFPLHILNVVTTEVVEYEATVEYETEKKDDNSLYTNQHRVIKNGKEGKKKVQARIYRKNGIEQDREILKETIIKKPVNAVVAVGTREIPRTVSRSGSKLNWPAAGSITSRFGWRWGRMHAGIDIANRAGTPVYAADPGTVIYSGYKGGYGNLVILDHGGGGFTTYYGHLQSSAVKVGDTLARGELLGFMGSTGNSTGNHVHFEVRLNNQPMDPMRFLK